MVIKKNRATKKRTSIKKVSRSTSKKKFKLSPYTKSFINGLQKILKAPFLLIDIFVLNVLLIIKKLLLILLISIKSLFKAMLRFKEFFFSIVFGLLSGSIGAVLIISYLELGLDNNNISESYTAISERILKVEEKLVDNKLKLDENKLLTENIELFQNKLNQSEESYSKLQLDISNLDKMLKKVELEVNRVQGSLVNLDKDLKNNSRLILSSSKTELSNRLYLAQSLIDRLESGIPYAPQLEELGKEGLDPALLRFASGGAPTLKDLEARLSARAGEQLDADRTKRDTTWRENLKKEFSKYVKIKPTNIKDIKGMPGILLRAEDSISRGDLARAIDEISSISKELRGPLDAWLTEAIARQNADIAARNLLAKTTAALQKRN